MVRDFAWPENGTLSETNALIWETRSVRDIATFGNHAMCAISLGRKTEPFAGDRFRLFGKTRQARDFANFGHPGR